MKKYAILPLALLLVACAPSERVNSDGRTIINGYGGGASVHEFKLSDGTRCVAVVGHYKAGLDCDFKGE
jgi:hypothetical protein